MSIREWRWVDEKGRAMTHWKQGEPPPIREASDSKGAMRVVFRDQDSCCENEQRNLNGGCDNCGAPCL